jgi:hypothetical protein
MDTEEVRTGDLRIGEKNIPFIVTEVMGTYSRVLITGEEHTVLTQNLKQRSSLLSRGS